MDLLKSELVLVTPEMAKHLRVSCKFERQRDLSYDHIGRLASEIAGGRYIAGTQVHFCVLGGEMFIVNGNQSLEAIAKAGVSIPMTFLYTSVSSMDEIAAIYSNHDIHRARDWAAAIRAHGVCDEFNKLWVNAFGGAMRIILRGFEKITGNDNGPELWSRDLRIAAMREYRPYAELYLSSNSNKAKKMRIVLRRAAVFAAGLETFRFQPTAAMEFWSGLARDDGLRANDPRKLLLNWLRENKCNGATGSKESAFAAAFAWNAFFTKTPIAHLRVKGAVRFRLAGTPWKDGERSRIGALDEFRGKSKKPEPTLIKLGTRVNGRGEAEPVALVTASE